MALSWSAMAPLRCAPQGLEPWRFRLPTDSLWSEPSMSIASPPALPSPIVETDDFGEARSWRPAVVLGANLHQPLAWWMDPIRTILFVVLPIFGFSAYLNRYNYWTFRASRDFVTSTTFWLGIYSAGMLILGVVIGRLVIRRESEVTLFDGDRATLILVRIGWITIAAYIVLFGALVVNYPLVIAVLNGSIGASDDLRDSLGRVPGVTSFVQLGVIYLAMIAMLATMTNYTVTPRLWTMTAVILFLVFLRSIFASERLALLEALASIGIIPLAYRWRPSPIRAIAPYIGIVFVFILFAAGEYYRSWQYYRYSYNSYFDFISQRFAGYFSTAINNGSGSYLVYGRDSPFPEITVGWITRFPVIGPILFPRGGETLHSRFLEMYASPEFNNPGGLYAAFLDYNFYLASIFMVFIGLVIGIIHRKFQNMSIYGFLLYPVVFLGMTDLIRIMYISDTRTLPMFLGGLAVALAIKSSTMPRDRFLSMAGHVSRGPSS